MLEHLVQSFCKILKENGIGIYLHGSMALGCYQPERSDIDLIVVVQNPLDLTTKLQLLEVLLAEQKQASGNGYELSIVLAKDCKPFVYPTPYEFHFSKAYFDEAKENKVQYCQKMKGLDVDLAAHFMVLFHRGIKLYGSPIRDIFGAVPPLAYLDSLLKDLLDYQTQFLNHEYYYILNACRIRAYLKDGLILSKQEGGEYELKKGALGDAPMIQSALLNYLKGEKNRFDRFMVTSFLEETIVELKQKIVELS